MVKPRYLTKCSVEREHSDAIDVVFHTVYSVYYPVLIITNGAFSFRKKYRGCINKIIHLPAFTAFMAILPSYCTDNHHIAGKTCTCTIGTERGSMVSILAAHERMCA